MKKNIHIVKVLSKAINEGDLEAFHKIIGGYISSVDEEELAKSSKLPIATIRSVASGTNYNIRTLFNITSAISIIHSRII